MKKIRVDGLFLPFALTFYTAVLITYCFIPCRYVLYPFCFIMTCCIVMYCYILHICIIAAMTIITITLTTPLFIVICSIIQIIKFIHIPFHPKPQCLVPTLFHIQPDVKYNHITLYNFHDCFLNYD